MYFLRKWENLVALLPIVIVVATWVVAGHVRSDESRLIVQLTGILIASIPVGLSILQWFENRAVHYEFGVRGVQPGVELWISNNGPTTFTVTALVARTEDHRARVEVSLTLGDGDRKDVRVDQLLRQLADGADPWFDFDAWFEYSSRGRKGAVASRPFNVFAAYGDVISAGPGYSGYAPAKCAKCRFPAAFKMGGLSSLESVRKRRRKVERELRSTCPNHKATWLLTPEDVGLVAGKGKQEE